MKIFNGFAVEKVPGRSTTYFEEFARIEESMKIDLQRQLSNEQFTKLDSMNVDILGVRTGFDPFAEYVLQRAGK